MRGSVVHFPKRLDVTHRNKFTIILINTKWRCYVCWLSSVLQLWFRSYSNCASLKHWRKPVVTHVMSCRILPHRRFRCVQSSSFLSHEDCNNLLAILKISVINFKYRSIEELSSGEMVSGCHDSRGGINIMRTRHDVTSHVYCLSCHNITVKSDQRQWIFRVAPWHTENDEKKKLQYMRPTLRGMVKAA
jgi:hypothetical protein